MNQTERLKQRKIELLQYWDDLSQKITCLQQELALETRSDERFRLQKKVEQSETDRNEIDQELNNIEKALSKKANLEGTSISETSPPIVPSNIYVKSKRANDSLNPLICWHKTNHEFTKEQQALVQQLYKDECKVYVEQEFKGGFGGATVLLVQPLNQEGERIARQVVKIGPKSELHLEYDNSKNYVAKALPLAAARIENYVEGTEYAALAYTFMGDGILGVTNTFEDYYQTTAVEQIINMLKGVLVESLGEIWYGQNKHYTCRFVEEYGHHLVEHLRLKIRKSSQDRIWSFNETQESLEGYQLLSGTNVEAEHLNFSEGDLLCIDNVVVTKVKPHEFKLQVIDQPRVIIKVEGNLPENIAVGEMVVVRGEVIYNRQERLETIVNRAFDHFPKFTIDAKQEMIMWGLNKQVYPNPLHHYPEIFSRLLRGRTSTVHGDLHLRNILVDAKGRGWLIDFALVTKRHNLYDFIKLESYIRQMILGQEQCDFSFADYLHFEETLTAASLGREGIPPTYPGLQKAYYVICAIRDAAAHYMGHPPDFQGEYFPALFLYSLAVLKYFDYHGAKVARLAFGTAVVVGKAIIEYPDTKPLPDPGPDSTPDTEIEIQPKSTSDPPKPEMNIVSKLLDRIISQQPNFIATLREVVSNPNRSVELLHPNIILVSNLQDDSLSPGYTLNRHSALLENIVIAYDKKSGYPRLTMYDQSRANNEVFLRSRRNEWRQQPTSKFDVQIFTKKGKPLGKISTCEIMPSQQIGNEAMRTLLHDLDITLVVTTIFENGEGESIATLIKVNKNSN